MRTVSTLPCRENSLTSRTFQPASRAAVPLMRPVFLDAGPLGLLSNARGKPRADGCRPWARGRLSAGVRVSVPEVAAAEACRKLPRGGATPGAIFRGGVAGETAFATWACCV